MQTELPQTSIVRELVGAALNAIPFLAQNEARQELVSVLASLESVSIPSEVGLEEVRGYITSYGISVDDETAREILTKISLDIELNYVNSAVQYHADEFISSYTDTEKSRHEKKVP